MKKTCLSLFVKKTPVYVGLASKQQNIYQTPSILSEGTLWKIRQFFSQSKRTDRLDPLPLFVFVRFCSSYYLQHYLISLQWYHLTCLFICIGNNLANFRINVTLCWLNYGYWGENVKFHLAVKLIVLILPGSEINYSLN